MWLGHAAQKCQSGPWLQTCLPLHSGLRHDSADPHVGVRIDFMEGMLVSWVSESGEDLRCIDRGECTGAGRRHPRHRPRCQHTGHFTNAYPHCCSVVTLYLTLWWPHGLHPTWLLCPWNFPSKNTGVDGHFLFQGIVPTQGSNPHLLPWLVDSLPLSHQASPL